MIKLVLPQGSDKTFLVNGKHHCFIATPMDAVGWTDASDLQW